MRLREGTDEAGPETDGGCSATGFVGATCIDFCRVRERVPPQLHAKGTSFFACMGSHLLTA